MYFYNENKTVYDNFKELLNEYNRLCATLENKDIANETRIKELEDKLKKLEEKETD